MHSLLVFVFTALVAVMACNKAPEPAAQQPITLSAKGQEFSPPIEKSRVPAAAWYCDMGLVHFARAEQGDGKCPVCGMELKQMPSP